MKQSKEGKDLSRIAFTLSRGTFDGVSRKKIILVYLLCVMVFGGLLILSVTMFSIDQFNEPGPIGEFIVAILSVILACSILPIIFLIIIIRNEKIRKEVLLWMEDAVELPAYAKKLDQKYWVGIPLIKLQVEFTFDGIKHTCTTESERRGIMDLGRPVGYFSGISKFSDRKVNILYSPQYNQVMILKDYDI